MNTTNIWIVDDDRSIRWVLEKALSQENFHVKSFECANDIIAALKKETPQAIISDIRMPGIDGLELLETLHQSHPNLPIIITTAHSDLESAVSSYQKGAFEYLPKPFDVDDVIAVVRRALLISNEPNEDPPPSPTSTEIIGEAPAMQEVFRAIGRLSHSHITVLINGESGTGKELVAQALHRHSPRAHKPFIALNMAAIPHDLLESELFGHEKGAFTGATSQRQGRFEQANQGTLFLDEIGDMPAETQTRLLRVLSDGEFYRVGGHTPIKVNVRIIAATHQNLEERVANHQFREDLFHRLNVIRIHLPPLRERQEDIPQLINHFFNKAAQELNVEPKVLLPETQKYLCSLQWPGNIRQLENSCRWLTVMAAGREIHLQDLPPELINEAPPKNTESPWEDALLRWASYQLTHGKKDILKTTIPTVERILIKVALEKTGGRKKEAADLLGWGRNTLTRKLKELDINGC